MNSFSHHKLLVLKFARQKPDIIIEENMSLTIVINQKPYVGFRFGIISSNNTAVVFNYQIIL